MKSNICVYFFFQFSREGKAKSRLHFLNPALPSCPFPQGNAFQLIFVAFGAVPAIVTERGKNDVRMICLLLVYMITTNKQQRQQWQERSFARQKRFDTLFKIVTIGGVGMVSMK